MCAYLVGMCVLAADLHLEIPCEAAVHVIPCYRGVMAHELSVPALHEFATGRL